ncbi:2'-5' RNA ligase family protein [Persicirhabdus sediminis]|uniref:2'-5' RNA ligase family protein n=1 Tax=Persicirhabdus sediminis TaxID=454144 RepID=A0A8J7SIG8_9BACT|nr:2'-5' RNA ligase family protein [Persicirhabdus sediminis]MBK1790589.1 2'-5' RNA ligase family protein [Persicirhabdus sediminis]
MLLSVAYPKLSKSAESLILEFRRHHDQRYVDVIDAHWTMIFPGSSEGIGEQQMQKHIASIASVSDQVEFCCRYALVYDDDSSDDYYIFLVPDEGFSQISKLHDRLYSDFMRPQLRLDIPYVPHIGIATSKDPDHLYELAQEWNTAGYEISGVIDSLTLCSYDGVKVQDIQNFALQNNKREQVAAPNP